MRVPPTSVLAVGLVLFVHGPWSVAEGQQLFVRAVLVAEMVPNAQLDPGEGVVMSFCIRNASNAPLVGVVGTLLNADGVVQSSGAQGFGTLEPQGEGCQLFRFRATGDCGTAVRPNFRIDPPGIVDTFTIPIGPGGLLEMFDEGSVGVMPLNFSAFAVGAVPFSVTAARADTAPHSVFAPDPSSPSDNYLTTRPLRFPAGPASLTFRHSYDTELNWDGGVLEISTDGATFRDILSAGGAFITGGYSGTLSPTGVNNPLAGRSAWTGTSNGFVTTMVQLPAATTAREVRLRWRFGTDASIGGAGWYLDTMSTSAVACPAVPGDAPGLLSSTVNGNLVSFSWLPPFVVAPTGYLLDVGFDGGATFAFTVPVGAQPVFTATGPDIVVWARVRSVLPGGGVGTPSNTVRVAIGTAAPPPASINLQTMVNGSTVALAWQLEGTGGPARATALSVGTTPGASDLGVVRLPAGATTFQASGVPGGTYHLGVRQVGPVLDGQGALAMLTVPGTCAPPRAPVRLTATATGRVATITWDLAALGPAPMSWRLEAGTASGLANLAVVTLPGRSITAPVPPGTYFFRVSAANACGVSPPSETISLTVP